MSAHKTAEAGHAVVAVNVFVNGPGGGNPVPFVPDAQGMTAEAMQSVARHYGHESAFMVQPTTSDADYALRYFVPNHEMEMCGHATVGAFWVLRQRGDWITPRARVQTLSGIVDISWDAARQRVWISQPACVVTPVERGVRERIARVLNLADDDCDIVNASTSRIKTLIRLRGREVLDRLGPEAGQVREVCEAAESTGLYPYTMDAGRISARQFPRASGYLEDAATGIAAAALWGYLAGQASVAIGQPQSPQPTTIYQGEAMGRPSAIDLLPRFDDDGQPMGVWLSGHVEWTDL